jgi:hypothetical protein
MGGVSPHDQGNCVRRRTFIGASPTSVKAAEREQVRMVINLISGVKMPFPENLGNNLAHFERIELKTNRASVACLRPHWTDKPVFLSRGESWRPISRRLPEPL